VVATQEGTVPGRSVSLLLCGEARDIPDSVLSALIPSVIGAEGSKIVMASTAGRPAGMFYQAVKNPTARTFLYFTKENLNPHRNVNVLEFLTKRLGVLSPTAARRELQNEFIEDDTSFLPSALVDLAVDSSLGESPGSPLPAYAFLDLSRRRDLTSLVVVVRDPVGRRPEAKDHLVTASVHVWDPKQQPTGEVPFEEVRAAVAQLPQRFPRLETLLIDEGSESGSVMPFARGQSRLAGRVKPFVATTDSNSAMWGTLAARLHARTLSIPYHERLIEELKSLRSESFAYGSKWRVVDSSSKTLHRDVSLALAGAVYAAGEVGVQAFAATYESVMAALPAEERVALEHAERERESNQPEREHRPRQFFTERMGRFWNK
jgi:hypothetical protein